MKLASATSQMFSPSRPMKNWAAPSFTRSSPGSDCVPWNGSTS